MDGTDCVNEAVPCYRYVAEVGGSLNGFQWRPVDDGGVLSDLDFMGFPHGNTNTFYVWESLGCGVHSWPLPNLSKFV